MRGVLLLVVTYLLLEGRDLLLAPSPFCLPILLLLLPFSNALGERGKLLLFLYEAVLCVVLCCVVRA